MTPTPRGRCLLLLLLLFLAPSSPSSSPSPPSPPPTGRPCAAEAATTPSSAASPQRMMFAAPPAEDDEGGGWPNATDTAEWADYAADTNSSEATADNSTRELLSRHRDDGDDDKPRPEKRSEVHSQQALQHNITILGLFELTARGAERPQGRSELAAARMAVRRINQMGVLRGYTLHLIHNDTKCDAGAGVDAFFHALYAMQSRVTLLLGSACEDVSESLAKVVPYWNIVQMSFGSTSPLLSDRHEFPLFSRTAAPQSSHDAARTALLRSFGWDSVAALSQDRDVHSLAVNSLVTALELANISCRASVTFAENDFDDQLNLLKELDTRIILGSFSREAAPNIFCKALGLGVVGEDYAWVLQGAPDDSWWASDFACEAGSLRDAVEGLLLVSSHGRSVDGLSDSGLTYDEFARAVGQEAQPVSDLAGQTFDAVWALGLALRNAQTAWGQEAPRAPRLHHFNYHRSDMAAEFLRQIALLNFTGVSGPVSFRQADRIGISLISQVQGGEARPVALFHPSWGELRWLGGAPAVRWAGGHTPVSRRVCVLRVLTVRPDAFLAVTSLAALGILVALLCLAFNLHYRRLKYIKLSSPRLNNMAAVGCVLVYAAVVLLGVDHATLPAGAPFSVVCTARVYLLSAGFSLAFGSMFTKTYRVHRIFTMSYGCYSGSKKKDTQLMSLVGALLLLDVLVVTLWAVVDPMGRHLHNLTLEISASDRGVVYQTQVEVCKSQYTESWLGALYVYKGLLLVVGLYMAWETRRVKIPALNDSHYIGLSVYFVVVCSGLSVALASLLWQRVTLAYVCSTALVLASTTATLCLLFLPKLHALQTGAADPVGQSMGLRLQSNTRRFVVDEGQELRYRVQVQNRVYRRELAALQAEAARLELQLESPSVAVSSASVSMEDSEAALSVRGAVRDAVRDAVREELFAAHPLAPLLLLAVLPPVTPRASWPSAAPERPRAASTHQAFQSEPQLEPAVSSDHHYMRRETFAGTGTPAAGKTGMLGRFLNLFSGRHSGLDNRGSSTGSIAGITSALRAHMGYIAGLVPSGGRRNDSEASSPGSVRGRAVPPHIAVLSADEDPRRKFSLAAMCVLSNGTASDDEDDDEDDDDKGGGHGSSGGGGGSSGKLRVRGSPRFPHRVVPIGTEAAVHSLGSSRLLSAAPPPSRVYRHQRSGAPGAELAGARCRSLEDARGGVRRSSLGGGGAFRAISLSPNCDVWAIKERGIPFTDFAVREKFLRAQHQQVQEKLHQQLLLLQQQQQQQPESADAAAGGEGEGEEARPARPADCGDGCEDQSPDCQSGSRPHERARD